MNPPSKAHKAAPLTNTTIGGTHSSTIRGQFFDNKLPRTSHSDTTVETLTIVRFVVSHETIPTDCVVLVVDVIDWRAEN